MRRMLDPKELGGGTANKLYKHTINCWSSTYGSIYLTIYNTSIEQINSSAKIKTVIKSLGKVIATGYIIKNESVYNVYLTKYLSNDDNAVAVGYRIDTTSGSTKVPTTSMALDYHFTTIEDDVKEVR